MELKEYLKVYKKYWVLIIIIAVLSAVLAFFYSRQLPTGYKNSQTFFLSPQTGSTNLETFHAQEKARNFTDTAVAIISSPDFKSQITTGGESLAVKKLAPQVLQITTFSTNPENSKILTKKAISLANEKFSTNLVEVESALEPADVAQKKYIYVLAGLVAGLAFAIFAISLKTYFKI